MPGVELQPVLPPLRTRREVRRRNAIVIIVFVLLDILLLMNNGALDTFTWRFTRWLNGWQGHYQWSSFQQSARAHPNGPWYRKDPPPMHGKLYKRFENFWRILRDGGEVQLTILLFFVVWVYTPGEWKSSLLLAAGTGAAGITGEIIRCILGRLRPDGTLIGPHDTILWHHRNNGANYWYLWRGFWDHHDLSFPGGHALLAFSTAAVLYYLSPRGKWLFLLVAAGTCISRVVMHAHFYGDVIAGGLLGWYMAWGICQWMGKRIAHPQADLWVVAG